MKAKKTTAKDLIVQVPKKITYKSKPLNLKHENPAKDGFMFLGKNITPESHPQVFDYVKGIESRLVEMDRKAAEVGKALKNVPYDKFIVWCFDVLNYMGHAALENKYYTPSYDSLYLMTRFYTKVPRVKYEESDLKRGQAVVNWLRDYTEKQDDVLNDISNVFFSSVGDKGACGTEEYNYFTPVLSALMSAMSAFHDYKGIEYVNDLFEENINRQLSKYITDKYFREEIKINDKVTITVRKIAA